MRPSDRLLSELDEWESRPGGKAGAGGPDSLRGILTRNLRGVPDDLVSDILERWSDLGRGPGGPKRARAWLDASCLVCLMDYNDDPPLEKKDWAYLREIFSAQAEGMDMDLLSYAMERVLEHGGF